jgi:protein-S-isoprenylcysteine O-methyltransferase Ste14
LEVLTISPAFVFGALVASVGGLGRLLAYRALGKHFTFEMSIKKDHGLITSGPYSVVRHPSYTALALNCLGMFFVFISPVGFSYSAHHLYHSTRTIP